jgi:hypothetical protein
MLFKLKQFFSDYHKGTDIFPSSLAKEVSTVSEAWSLDFCFEDIPLHSSTMWTINPEFEAKLSFYIIIDCLLIAIPHRLRFIESSPKEIGLYEGFELYSNLKF